MTLHERRQVRGGSPRLTWTTSCCLRPADSISDLWLSDAISTIWPSSTPLRRHDDTVSVSQLRV